MSKIMLIKTETIERYIDDLRYDYLMNLAKEAAENGAWEQLKTAVTETLKLRAGGQTRLGRWIIFSEWFDSWLEAQ